MPGNVLQCYVTAGATGATAVALSDTLMLFKPGQVAPKNSPRLHL